MPAAAIPACDLRRVAALHACNLLDTEPDDMFDRFTRLVAGILDTPIAAISFVDRDRQFLKSTVGLTVRETPRQTAFCAHTILAAHPLIVNDAEQDPRFADNPLVVGGPRYRFYAGAPLTTSNGFHIGALCAIDTRPRQITPQQKAALVELSNAVMATIELIKTVDRMRTFALTDALTELPNRVQFFHTLHATIAGMSRAQRPFSLMYLDCDDFKRLNDERGHQVGDDLLCLIAGELRQHMRASDLPARLGGDEFAAILPETGPRAAHAIAERVRDRFGRSVRANHLDVTISIGVATFLTPPASPQVALAQVDSAMYEAKGRGKNQVAAIVIGGQRQRGRQKVTRLTIAAG